MAGTGGRPWHARGRWVAVLLAGSLAGSLLPAASAQTSGLPPGGTFWDDDGNVHEGMIEAIVDAGITVGCSSDGRNYCPADAVTRGQMATFLRRALNLAPATDRRFADIEGHPHADSIDRVAEAGIASGRTPDTFEPDAPVTRAQMATFLANALDLTEGDTDRGFADVHGTHADAIARVAAAGITVGCTTDGTRFCPSDTVTRAQMASFLGRALDLDPRVPPPRVLVEGPRVVERYMDALSDREYGSARARSDGIARGYIDYVAAVARIDGAFPRSDYRITSPGIAPRSIGERRWRLDLTLEWELVPGDVVELEDFEVVQRSDGTFRVVTYRRDGLPLSSYVRTGTIAETPSDRPVQVRLIAQFRRADLTRPTVIHVLSLRNDRPWQVTVDDWMASYTSRSDNASYLNPTDHYPMARAGQTIEFILVTEDLRAATSSADLRFMVYGPNEPGPPWEFEQSVSLRVPAWSR